MVSNSSTQATSSNVEAFLSYSHESDRTLILAEPLMADLAGMIKLRSNRHVEIFHDRTSVKWGERFRASIANGLESASVLFVLATTHYLTSDNCRSEFKDFLNAARATGSASKKRLILPIVPIDAPSVFVEDSDDEVAREIAAIQYELIEDAVINGRGTPEWKKALIKLADRFIEVVSDAEAEASQGRAVAVTTDNTPGDDAQGDDEGSGDGGDERGVFDALADLETDSEQSVATIETLGQRISTVGSIFKEADFSNPGSAKQVNAKLMSFSKRLQGPAAEIGKLGMEVRNKTNDMDLSIRRLVAVAQKDESGMWSEHVRKFLTSAKASMSQISQVESQMQSLVTAMAPAETVSSSLRNALKPMRTGVVATGDAVRTIQKWGPELLDD